MSKTALGCLVLLTVLLMTQAAEAQYAQPAPTGATRRVHLNTSPPGMRAIAGSQRIAVPTPYTFDVPAGNMTAIVVDGPGMERLTVPIPVGHHDLYLNVQMSRPVFEAGVALFAIGAALLATFVAVGAVFQSGHQDHFDNCLEDDSYNSCRAERDDEMMETWSLSFLSFGLGGSVLTIPGILMMILDRRRAPTYDWNPPATI